MSTTPSSNIPILTVSQLTHAIKLHLEGTFPLIWLQGEISNCKLQSSGHLYFSLKDPRAQISAVMFRGDMATLTMLPKDGDHMIIRGELNVYPPSGRYQIIVREMRHMGLGELLIRLEELKQKLQKKGWFNPEHKKPLPKHPKRIGVVTSPTGAVIQDILNILSRRFSNFHLILNSVRVQGEGAAKEIAQAINQFNEYDLVDVMIVGRGGGSIEDLWAFNEEIVAEAIFNSRIPIISAVGHETDYCIADFVADVRAPTPSAAAELVSTDKNQQLIHLKTLQNRIQQTLAHQIKHRRHQLNGILKQPLLLSPYNLLGAWIQRLDDLRMDIDASMKQIIHRQRLTLEGRNRQVQALKPSAQIIHFRQKLAHWTKALDSSLSLRLINTKSSLTQKQDRLSQYWSAQQSNRRRHFNAIAKQKQLDQAWQRIIGLRKERLITLSSSLHSIDPKNLLKKGYSILFAEKDHSVITSINSIGKDQEIRALVSDGELLTIVKEVFSSDDTTKRN
jgi:exodeoxyribonuclease VII large subunit